MIHGLSDRMVHVSGGRATSAAIPGSELLLVDGMGHDLPPEIWESVTDASVGRRTVRGRLPDLSPVRTRLPNRANSASVI